MKRKPVKRKSATSLMEMPRNAWLPDIEYVQVATHSRCNANCVFCPYSESEHYKNKGVMTDETWNRILLNLVPWRDTLKKFCPYLMQEPLIDRTIFDKIEQIYHYFPKVKVEISTNGAALTDTAVDNILRVFANRNHDVWVSHHGTTKETLEYIMQIKYENTHANLLNLLTKANGRLNIKIRGAGQSKAVDKVYFTREEYITYWKDLLSKHNINTTRVSVDAFEFHDRAGTLHRTERDANLLNKGIVREIGPKKPFSCSRIDKWLHFMHDGSIRICCMDYHHEIKLPNINEMSLLDYFHSEAYEDLVRKVSGKSVSDANFICKRCTSPGG